jgi:UDP-N-acetylmuramyl pentapeptide phosphotransferase/UDP-N-acetylglucosamine-1-phosphate transferase
MNTFIFSFLVSFIICFLIIQLSKNFSAVLDEKKGPQKVHEQNVPRVGGLAIWAALIATGFYFFFKTGNFAELMWKLLLSSLPFFLIGILEDITKSIRAQYRFFIMLCAAILPFYLMDARLIRSSISVLDQLLSFRPASFIITIIAIAGFANAINIIDGLNGVSGVISILIMGGIAYIAFKVGDLQILIISFAVVGAILGFLVFNYPGGIIFLGDGGAYLIGSLIAILSILIVLRNKDISPWFPAMLLIYPIWETIFSIYRRRFKKKKSALKADNLHLHTLILKRVVRGATNSNNSRVVIKQNSLASIYIWAFASWPIIWAVIFWNKTFLLAVSVVLFVLFYLMLYRCLVKFRVPKWMFIKKIF